MEETTGQREGGAVVTRGDDHISLSEVDDLLRFIQRDISNGVLAALLDRNADSLAGAVHASGWIAQRSASEWLARMRAEKNGAKG